MSTELAQNVAHAGLRAPATSAATSVSVELITGAWPTVPFAALMEDGTSRKEQVLVTGVSGNTLTVTRAQGGTSAVAHDTMSSVDVITTLADFGSVETILAAGADLPTHIAAAAPHTALTTHDADTTVVHGITDTTQIALKNAANTFTEDVTIESDNKLLFAADTNLYRGGADTLRTDDNLYASAIVLTAATPVLIFGLSADAELSRSAANVISLGTDDCFEFVETTDPAAPAANKARLYAKDVGGKTALMVRFPTGAVQQVAIEP